MMEKLLLLAVVGGLLARSRSAESSAPARSDKPARSDAPPAYAPPQSEQEELLWIPNEPPVLLNPSVLDLFNAPPGAEPFVPGVPGTPSRDDTATENPNARYTHEGYPVPTRAQMRAFQRSLNSAVGVFGLSHPRIAEDGIYGGQTDALLRTLGEAQLEILSSNAALRQEAEDSCNANERGRSAEVCAERFALPLNPLVAVPGITGWNSSQIQTAIFDIDAATRHFGRFAALSNA